MRKINVLFIEHCSSRHVYKMAIEKAIANVDMISEFSSKEIISKMKSKIYDLIVTDAVFLPMDIDHGDEGYKEEYKLNEVVSIVRQYDNQVKIIVFTEYQERLRIKEDLPSVDFVIDKSSTNLDLLKWQIERFKEQFLFTNYKEHALMHAIFELINRNPNIIWGKEISEMLYRYRNGINEYDQIKAIKESIKDIAYNELKLTTEFDSLYNNLIAQEGFNIATKPKNWGHLRHCINVFWLGYYMINSGFIDNDQLICALFKKQPNEITEIDIQVINKAWFIASIFHDIGHFGQEITGALTKLNELLKIYPDETIQLNSELKINQITNSHFITISCEKIQEFHDHINVHEDKIDHGVLSAYSIYKTAYKEVDESVYNPAIQAIAFHNLIQKSKTGISGGFYTFPLLNLLILCDLLEIWDRDTGFESRFDVKALEKIELIDFQVVGDELRIKVNYKTHSAINHNDEKIKDARGELKDKIKNLLFTQLDKINNDDFPKLHLEFWLNNRTMIEEWKL